MYLPLIFVHDTKPFQSDALVRDSYARELRVSYDLAVNSLLDNELKKIPASLRVLTDQRGIWISLVRSFCGIWDKFYVRLYKVSLYLLNLAALWREKCVAKVKKCVLKEKKEAKKRT